MNWFSKRKRYETLVENELQATFEALRENAHFKNFVEHIHERRENSIRALQTEKAISCANRHFMEAGKVEAFDELLDDMELWWRNLLD